MTAIADRGYRHPDRLVSTDWVAAHSGDPNVRIIESNEDTLLYATGHVPGAVHVDWTSDLNDQLRIVENDTFAVLRAGTDRGWGIAVVCGSGINCVGVAPDGRHARFPSLGAITGDWGGGYDVGLAGVVAAARSEDGRISPFARLATRLVTAVRSGTLCEPSFADGARAQALADAVRL